MSAPKKQEYLPPKTSGLLQVDVAPSHEVQEGRWKNFRQRVRVFFGRGSQKKTKQYLDALEKAGNEWLREVGVKNAHLEADIQLKLAQARKLGAEARQAEIEAEKQGQLSEIEIQKLRVRAQIEALEQLQNLGIDITPILDDTGLTGLEIKRSEEKNLLRTELKLATPKKKAK